VKREHAKNQTDPFSTVVWISHKKTVERFSQKEKKSNHVSVQGVGVRWGEKGHDPILP
jgi:hypothetical protein